MIIWKPVPPTHNQETESNQSEKCMLSKPRGRDQVGGLTRLKWFCAFDSVKLSQLFFFFLDFEATSSNIKTMLTTLHLYFMTCFWNFSSIFYREVTHFTLIIYFIKVFIMLKYDFLMYWDHFGVLFTFGLHISKHVTAGKEKYSTFWSY